MANDSQLWINRLGLERHPEGGFFRETYRSEGYFPGNAAPEGFGGPRCFSTAIYFLLRGDDFSAFHRIKSDELWHFYAGSSLIIHVIDRHGDYHGIGLGGDWESGDTFQAVVKAGCWFGAHLTDTASFALVGCTVAPGFDYRDFEMADRWRLLKEYPQHAAIITKLTRGEST